MNNLTTLDPDLGWLYSFAKTNTHYFFGCSEGIVKYTKDFKLIDTLYTNSWVLDVCKYDANTLLLAESQNNIEIISIDLMQTLYQFNLPSIPSDSAIFQIKRCEANSNEFYISTYHGFLLIEVK